MTNEELYALKYPIGEFEALESVSDDDLKQWIADIRNFPSQVAKACDGVVRDDLEKTYRPSGWNVKQVIHHCADSHMNAYMRFKLSLTEDTPTIRPYFEDRWANLIDGNDSNIEGSLHLLTGLHYRWNMLLNEMSPSDFERSFFHPEHERTFRLDITVANYSWHCRHHLEHIKNALAS
ncbi:putative metal-dependent hydrolase [Chitinophagales bacterium]|nr:putative metal-dependent hydrolase [Chitinophagales bacterium]